MTTTTATKPGSTRALKAQQTRDHIVETAHQLFAEHGYRDTSLRDIAAAAGISHPGLQRHFASKDVLLAAVLDAITRASAELVLAGMLDDGPGNFSFGALARHNATIPGYLPLYAALTGEASSTSHPAHELLREHYAQLIEMATGLLEEAILHDTVSPDRDARDEVMRVIAAWDGMQLLSQFLPDRVDLVSALESYQELLTLPIGWRWPDDPGPGAHAVPIPTVPDPAILNPELPLGYRSGRARRSQIVADAAQLFAHEGYSDTSLQDIADAVGVSKSTLLHHYASKAELLMAVLVDHDREVILGQARAPAERAADELRALILNMAEHSLTTPGFVGLDAVLSCESVPRDQPAHTFFADRFRLELDHLTALMRAARDDGDLPAHRDPDVEAVWLLALWEGLQYQWLYDPTGIDVLAQLSAHFDDLLPRSREAGH